jgi:hypothetical protein
MKKLTLTIILFPMLAFAGLNPVLQNPYTTNTPAAADAHVIALVSGPTNGVTLATLTNVVNGIATTLHVLVATNSPDGNVSASLNQVTNLDSAILGIVTNKDAAVLVIVTNLNASTLTTVSNINTANLVITTNLVAAQGAANTNDAAARVTAALVTATNLNSATLTVVTNKDTALLATVTNINSATLATATNLLPTAANNSYTTNFFFPSYQTNLVFVLPSISTNYLVNGKLFIVSRSANPLGINIASGATIPTSTCWGQTYSCPPFVLMQSVDGTAFDFGMGGDNSVSFVATNGAPYTLTATQMTNAFSMRAVFDWTVHK